jgi:hypothetical protein
MKTHFLPPGKGEFLTLFTFLAERKPPLQGEKRGFLFFLFLCLFLCLCLGNEHAVS